MVLVRCELKDIFVFLFDLVSVGGVVEIISDKSDRRWKIIVIIWKILIGEFFLLMLCVL